MIDAYIDNDGNMIDKAVNQIVSLELVYGKTGKLVDINKMNKTVSNGIKEMDGSEIEANWILASRILKEKKETDYRCNGVEHFGNYLLGFIYGRMIGLFEGRMDIIHKISVDSLDENLEEDHDINEEILENFLQLEEEEEEEEE